MNHWIVVAAAYEGDDESFSAREIFERRMRDRFWGLSAKTNHRRSLKRGDRAVFYVASPESAFAGTARLASDSFTLSPAQTEKVSHGTDFFAAEYGVWLEEVDQWITPRPIAPIASQLSLIRDPKQWWVYLQGGLHPITPDDYARIVGSAEPELTEDEFEEAVYTLEELDASAPLDQRREVSVRTEQGFLRQHLFGGKPDSTCTICGHHFPVELLRAAHIKRRSECSVEEKLDYCNVVTPMCTFGCDELFERGYVVVRSGRVAKGQGAGVTPPVADYIARITDRPCVPYYGESRPYFDWHAQKHM